MTRPTLLSPAESLQADEVPCGPIVLVDPQRVLTAIQSVHDHYTGFYRSDDEIRFAINRVKSAVAAALFAGGGSA